MASKYFGVIWLAALLITTVALGQLWTAVNLLWESSSQSGDDFRQVEDLWGVPSSDKPELDRSLTPPFDATTLRCPDEPRRFCKDGYTSQGIYALNGTHPSQTVFYSELLFRAFHCNWPRDVAWLLDHSARIYAWPGKVMLDEDGHTAFYWVELHKWGSGTSEEKNAAAKIGQLRAEDEQWQADKAKRERERLVAKSETPHSQEAYSGDLIGCINDKRRFCTRACNSFEKHFCTEPKYAGYRSSDTYDMSHSIDRLLLDAVKKDQKEDAKHLLHLGASPTGWEHARGQASEITTRAVDGDGRNAFHLAVAKGWGDNPILTLTTDSSGRSTIHERDSVGRGVLRLMLDKMIYKDLDAHRKDNRGKTPHQTARDLGLTKTASWLKMQGVSEVQPAIDVPIISSSLPQ